MFKALKRWWKYWGAKVNSSFNEHADPKIQLEQAITEAQEQHRRLKEQAANVIANQKQAEMRLNRSMAEYEKLNGNARQAVLMADEDTKSGDEKKTVEYTQAAETTPKDFAAPLAGWELPVRWLLVEWPASKRSTRPRPWSCSRHRSPSRRRPRFNKMLPPCRRSSPNARSCSRNSTRRRCRKR